MLGWLILGALFCAAVITISVSYLDHSVAKKKLQENRIKKGVIKELITSNGVSHIKLDAIDEDGNEKQVEFEADDYDAYEISCGDVIYA